MRPTLLFPLNVNCVITGVEHTDRSETEIKKDCDALELKMKKAQVCWSLLRPPSTLNSEPICHTSGRFLCCTLTGLMRCVPRQKNRNVNEVEAKWKLAEKKEREQRRILDQLDETYEVCSLAPHLHPLALSFDSLRCPYVSNHAVLVPAPFLRQPAYPYFRVDAVCAACVQG
jgi:hypothetical protein